MVDSKKKNNFYAHTRWGRVGEDGQVKTVQASSLDDAKQEFEKKFKDKSGLAWGDRNEKPKGKKYTFIEKAYEADDGDKDEDDDDDDSKPVKSELDLPTQRLMELIFKFVFLHIHVRVLTRIARIISMLCWRRLATIRISCHSVN